MSKPDFNYYKALNDRQCLIKRFYIFAELLDILRGSEDKYPNVLRCIVNAVDYNVREILDIDEKIFQHQETQGIHTPNINYLRR
jgi:hypothetical protein